MATQSAHAEKGEWTDLATVSGFTIEAGETYLLEHHQDTVLLVRIGASPGADDDGHILTTGTSDFTVTVPEAGQGSVWVRPQDVDVELIATGV